MKLTLAVTERDNAYTVTTNLGVVVAWERKFKRKASQLGDGIGVEDLAFMAWECCKQHNIPVPAIFDDYVKRLENIEVVDNEPVNPSNEAHTSTP
jgi:hypothetical protein